MVRELPADDWGRLVSVFEQNKTVTPDPDLARILVAEEDAKITGFIVIQLVPHLEPIYVAPEQRGTDTWSQLAEAAVAFMPLGSEFYAFAPRPAIEHMAERVGMVKLPWSVMRGVKPLED